MNLGVCVFTLYNSQGRVMKLVNKISSNEIIVRILFFKDNIFYTKYPSWPLVDGAKTIICPNWSIMSNELIHTFS